MDYEIILSPDLGISAEEFAAAWNATTETHDIAEAHLATPKGAQFDPTLIVTIIISVTTGVAANAIYEQIKKLLEKRKGHKHTHIERTTKRDGTERLIVDMTRRDMDTLLHRMHVSGDYEWSQTPGGVNWTSAAQL